MKFKNSKQLQNHSIFKKIHCAFLQLITVIVGMSVRAHKMYTLGTYYNIIDTRIKLQWCLTFRLCDSGYGGKEEIVLSKFCH